MTNPFLEGLIEGLQQSVAFKDLVVMNRPPDTLWHAHNTALLQLRLPLYAYRLQPKKAAPKAKIYDEAIQSGLAILAAFAQQAGTNQAIVRLTDKWFDSISFQPRPSGANWTAEHAITPEALHEPLTDPLIGENNWAAVWTGDMLHLAGKTALAYAHKNHNGEGTATFEFFETAQGGPCARLVYRPLGRRRATHRVALATVE